MRRSPFAVVEKLPSGVIAEPVALLGHGHLATASSALVTKWSSARLVISGLLLRRVSHSMTQATEFQSSSQMLCS